MFTKEHPSKKHLVGSYYFYDAQQDLAEFSQQFKKLSFAKAKGLD